ncbi:MAG: hypothetical protein JWL81_2022 [Verrucomicrobiales bacterium]|nr:hypothetical protein [Verrucomicrobiales bacterium]
MFSKPTDDSLAHANLLSLQRTVKLLVTALAALLLAGGTKVSAKTPELTEAQLSARLADPQSGLRDFVALVEKSMIGGEMWPVEELVDQRAILNRATDGVQMPGAATIKEMFADSTQQAWQQNGVTRDFAGSNFRFLRIRTFKNRAGLLFRSAGDNSSLNFFSFVINEVAPRTFRITDIYTIGLNEYTSETLRRTYIHLAASLQGGDAQDASGGKDTFADSLEAMTSISQDLKAGKWREVLDACSALPPAIQNDRTVLLIRLEAAENYSITSRSAVLEDWLKANPDEMELPLKFVDHYLTQDRWDDAERVVTRLLERTGGDARLMLQLGNIDYRRERDKRLLQAAASRN